MTWKDKLPRGFHWLGSDEWNYFVLPDVLFIFVLFGFVLMMR